MTIQYTNLRPEAGPAKLGVMDTLSLIKKAFFDRSERIPMGKLPEVKPDLIKFLIPTEEMKFIWFGHSTLLLHLDGQTILIDPVFSGSASPFSFLVKRFQPPVLSLSELPPIDSILLSHDHYDHLDKETIKFFKNKTTKFIVPLGVGSRLQKWGIPSERIRELSWGESVSESTITFTAAPAQHFSGRGLFDRNKTLWASWVIKGQFENIFFSGDSGYDVHFKDIGNRFGPFQYAFLENGQYNERWPDVHMQPEDTIQAYVDLNAQTLIPIHWGMFDLSLHHWSEPIIRLSKFTKAWHIPMLTPRLGEVIEASTHKSENWWEGLATEESQLPQFTTQELALK
jgi:L-ascorbate metabolism protein UlaG (beta-lactamase superfamily)